MRTTLFSIALAAALLAAACGTRKRVPYGDGAPPGGDGIVFDTLPPDGRFQHLDLGLRGRDLVVNRITIPDSTTATTLGVDYTGDGTVDNALGSILGALSGITSSMDLQSTIDGAVNSGATLMLLRLQAHDYVNAPGAALWSWTAQPQSCCTTPTAPATCKQQAAAGCFNGKHGFTPIQASASQLSGSIKGGALRFGPDPLRLRLALPGYGNVDVRLKSAYVRGRYNGTQISQGILAGAVEQTELQSTLIPAIVSMLNATLQDPSVDKTTKDTIRTLFDSDSSGAISINEVANNALIKTFLAGDVDVDHDGKTELSLGLGFTAVPAVIKP